MTIETPEKIAPALLTIPQVCAYRGVIVNSKRDAQIAERRAQMSKQYRPTYNRAMNGKSRKAAMRAFCCECCGWEIREVFLCTDLGCPLYPYRARSRVSQGVPQSIPEKPGSKKLELSV